MISTLYFFPVYLATTKGKYYVSHIGQGSGKTPHVQCPTYFPFWLNKNTAGEHLHATYLWNIEATFFTLK